MLSRLDDEASVIRTSRVMRATSDALVELVATALGSDAQALSQYAQAWLALIEIAAALAAMNIPVALALQERIKQLR